jgi:hypothetical protein
VGYGKPPQHGRFSSGRSGNPRGRPKGSQNLTTLLSQALNQKVTVTEHGQSRQITKREAMITQLVNRAAGKGDLAAMRLLLDMEGRAKTNPDGAGTHHPGSQPTTFQTPEAREIPNFDKMSTADLEIVMQACWIMDGNRERPPVPMPPEDPGAQPEPSEGNADDAGDTET